MQMFYFPAFGLFALAPGSYFSVQDEPSAYDANFLAGIRFAARERKILDIGTTATILLLFQKFSASTADD